MAQSICIIFNPTARGDKARRFREALNVLATQSTLKPTTAPGEARRLAAEAVREGFQTIVAGGGDGTVNEVVNGIGDEPDGLERVRFGLLPLGTVNVFAREVGLPGNVRGAWEAILQGNELRIDLPIVEYNQNSQPLRRYFVQMAGAGFDARIVDLVAWETKKRLGAMAYVLAALRAMRVLGAKVSVRCEKGTMAGELVLVGNGRFYGGSFPVFPQADWQDGLLDVTLFPRVTYGRILLGGLGIVFNSLYSWGGARHFKAARLSLSSAEPVPFHVEGENTGHLPAEFKMSRHKLRVLAPASR